MTRSHGTAGDTWGQKEGCETWGIEPLGLWRTSAPPPTPLTTSSDFLVRGMSFSVPCVLYVCENIFKVLTSLGEQS